MKDSDLRHLRRSDLLALLEELSRENDRLRAELEEANRKLEARDLRISECGSLAEAALVLSGVFEAADKAANTYVELVRTRAEGEGKQSRVTGPGNVRDVSLGVPVNGSYAPVAASGERATNAERDGGAHVGSHFRR